MSTKPPNSVLARLLVAVRRHNRRQIVQNALAIREELAAADPSNADKQRDLFEDALVERDAAHGGGPEQLCLAVSGPRGGTLKAQTQLRAKVGKLDRSETIVALAARFSLG